MSALGIEDAIRQVMEAYRRHDGWLSRDKTRTRYAAVDPILWALGWRTWNPAEFQPDFSLGQRGQVDYALFDSNGNLAVLIEVHAARSRLSRDRIQLWNHTRGMTHGIGVLTYGFYWEVYDLSIRTRNIDWRCVARLALDPAEPDGFQRVADALHHWLDRSNWP